MRNVKNSFKLILLIVSIFISNNSCMEVGKVISIKSNNAENITATGAELYATVIDVGESSLSAHGWCWSVTENPTTSDNAFDMGTRGKAGEFSFLISGLEPATDYYVRPFASGNGETVYGEPIKMKTHPLLFTVTSPKEGDMLGHDLTYQIEWTDNISDRVKIELFKNTTLVETITSEIENSGSFSWTVPNFIAESNDYHILISSVKISRTKAASGTFSIVSDAPPTVSTDGSESISFNSATVLGTIINFGTDNSATQHGHCWSLSSNPIITDNKTELGATSSAASFSSNLSSLNANTTYYVRAYATNSAGTNYGGEISFTTNELPLPSITTTAVTDISYFTATSGGEVLNDNGFTVTERGICWATLQNPTLSDNYTIDGSGIGTFTSNLINLTDNTMYYVRAYATNSQGTSYGQEETLTTLEGTPTVTTNTVSAISYFTATCGGEVLTEGSSSIINRGLCWSTSSNPTITDGKTTDGAGIGTFISSLSSLLENTTYYVRAYATNSTETAYGEERTFTTLKASPTLTTNTVSAISYNTATCGGNITNQGYDAITDRGVCWSTTSNPTITDDKTVDGAGTGSFTSSLTNLTVNTTYYVRAYATNSVSTAYGNEINFTTDANITVTDVDGNVYNTVTIGTQVWMVENLKTTKYNDNTSINYPGTDNTAWDNDTYGAYAWYHNDAANKDTYGALYNWYAVRPGTGKYICPTGWHVPSDAEWTILTNYLGGEALAGGKLKEIGTTHWQSPNTGATNETGFTALPGGYRWPQGNFAGRSSIGYWWSTSVNVFHGYYRQMNNTVGSVDRASNNMSFGFSVRCLKD